MKEKQCRRRSFKRRLNLRLVLVIFVFLILLVTFAIVGTVSFILHQLGVLELFQGPGILPPLLVMLLFSILLGTVLAGVVGKRTLKPLHKIIDATKRVAAGDFTVQLETDSVPEIEDLTKSFNTMVRELNGIETLRSDFISNFSHEFKTPIVSIRGFAKLLREDHDLTEEERAEYIDIIIQESERLSGLASNVLDLSKVENTTILTDKKYFFLDEQIRRTAALMEPLWLKKGLDVKIEMDSVTIFSDEDLLKQVWVNLLDNAIKYSGEGGHIAIALKRRGDEAEFRITDDGVGMDEHTLAHLFDRFYQGDKSHQSSGNGLGLALVQRILTLCGGRVEAESRPGEGSTFTVTLPIGSDEAKSEKKGSGSHV